MKKLLYVLSPLAALFLLATAVQAAPTVCQIGNGCTATSTAPAYGNILIGGKNGEYEFIATSTLGGGGGGAVSSVFGRTGAITAQSGDYSTSQVTEGSNLYYTLARFASALAGTTTDAVHEGSTNLYFTAARAIAALTGQNVSIFTNNVGYLTPTTFNIAFDNRLSATSSLPSITTLAALSLPYSQLTGTPNLSQYLTLSSWYSTTTDQLREGSTNLYFTNARAVAALTGQSNSLFTNGAGYLTSLAGAASSTLLSDNNVFSGADIFTNASSDFSGTWQTLSPSHFQTALTLPLSIANGGTATSTWLANSVPFFNGSNFTEQNPGFTFSSSQLSTPLLAVTGSGSNNEITVSGNSTNTASNFFDFTIGGSQTVANSAGYYGFNIANTYSDATPGDTLGLLSGGQFAPGNASAGIVTQESGIIVNPTNTGTGTTTNLFGITVTGNTSGVATTTAQYGISSIPKFTGSGAITSLEGLYTGPEPTGSGSVFNDYGINADPFPTTGYTGTITNEYGVFTRGGNNASGGTVSHYYSAFLGTPSKTGTIGTEYGLYQQDAAANNYFAGNVGIGTAAPYGQLDVASTSAGALTDALILRNSSITQGTEVGLFFEPSNAGTNIRGARISGVQENGSNSIGLKFYTGIGSSITEKMRITSAGNVGIGTTTPVTPLDVNGNVQIEGSGASLLALDPYGTATDNVDEVFTGRAAVGWNGNVGTSGLWLQGFSKPVIIGTGSSFGSGEVARFTTTGQVGIGTTTPDATLQVKGSFARNVNDQAMSYTIATSSDFLVAITSTASARTVTLPLCTATTTGEITDELEYEIKDESGGAATNNITLTPVGSQKIDGSSNKVINTNYGFTKVYCDGQVSGGAWFTF